MNPARARPHRPGPHCRCVCCAAVTIHNAWMGGLTWGLYWRTLVDRPDLGEALERAKQSTQQEQR